MSLDRLFDAHDTLRAVIESALEGRVGKVKANGSPPHVARVDVGCYAFFGGDASSAAAERLLREVAAPRELLVGRDQAWRDLLQQVRGARLEDRPMRTFSPHGLEPTHLRTMNQRLPAGLTLARLDADSAVQLDAGLRPHALETFEDAQRFVAEGFGYGVFHESELVSASTSYTISSKRVEVSISTRERFRGRGLARAVAAAMLLHCLEAGLRPEWSTSNPVSKRLALDLGFRPAGLCDVFFLH